MGIGDWGFWVLGLGYWAQSPIPKDYHFNAIFFNYFNFFYILFKNNYIDKFIEYNRNMFFILYFRFVVKKESKFCL